VLEVGGAEDSTLVEVREVLNLWLPLGASCQHVLIRAYQ
jgi:hypothetical protein